MPFAFSLHQNFTPPGGASMWKVREIMQAQVVTVAPQMPVRELVQVFASAHISGAPVIGSTGEIMGVVSASDVMALAAYGADANARNPWADEEGAGDEESDAYFRHEGGSLEFEVTTADGTAEYLVEDIMTPAAFSVKPDDSIHELARFLLRGRIHRALVVEEGKLIGIATTFDVLRAVADNKEEPGVPDLALAGS